jgi:hypothetical protein
MLFSFLTLLLGCLTDGPGAACRIAPPPETLIRGVVTTSEGLPVEGAEITVAGTTLVATTDSMGRFVLRGLPAGTHAVRIRRIGYKASVLGASLEDGDVKDVRIVLERGTYELPEITVQADRLKPIEYGWTTRYDDFFRRKQLGFGKFFTRSDIERWNPYRTANLLALVPGVHVRFRHPGASGTDVEFTRCERVGVWIDGWKQRYNIVSVAGGIRSRRPLDARPMLTGIYLETVLPSQIEAMEVYRGPAEMPAEFLDDACAAIVIWTR